MPIFLLSERLEFPPPRLAGPDGLLAVGGDLSVERLLLAYRQGIFPWFGEGDPIIWWSPDPRLVLFPEDLATSRRLKRTLRRRQFRVTMDCAFHEVIRACAQTRIRQNEGTWIVREMIDAYCRLHLAGYAHSVESWYDGRLAGGLYGVSLGGCFFGESMFTRVSNASKIAFVTLVEHLSRLSFDLIDCQVHTEHLVRFGARHIARERFLNLLAESLQGPTLIGSWQFSDHTRQPPEP